LNKEAEFNKQKRKWQS